MFISNIPLSSTAYPPLAVIVDEFISKLPLFSTTFTSVVSSTAIPSNINFPLFVIDTDGFNTPFSLPVSFIVKFPSFVILFPVSTVYPFISIPIFVSALIANSYAASKFLIASIFSCVIVVVFIASCKLK